MVSGPEHAQDWPCQQSVMDRVGAYGALLIPDELLLAIDRFGEGESHCLQLHT